MLLYSSGLAILPKGIFSEIFLINSSDWSFSTPPGQIALHLTFSLTQYVDKYLVNPIIPDLTTEYVTGLQSCSSFLLDGSRYNLWSGAISPKSEETLIIVPPFEFFDIS